MNCRSNHLQARMGTHTTTRLPTRHCSLDTFSFVQLLHQSCQIIVTNIHLVWLPAYSLWLSTQSATMIKLQNFLFKTEGCPSLGLCSVPRGNTRERPVTKFSILYILFVNNLFSAASLPRADGLPVVLSCEVTHT